MRFPKYLLCAAISLSLLPAAFAKDKDHDKGRDNDRHASAHDRDNDRDRRHDRDDRDDHKHSVAQNSSRPPGWDKGKKTGWNGGNVPPGQAKKSHAQTVHHDRDHDRDAHHTASTAHHVTHHDPHVATAAHHDHDRDRKDGSTKATTASNVTPTTTSRTVQDNRAPRDRRR